MTSSERAGIRYVLLQRDAPDHRPLRRGHGGAGALPRGRHQRAPAERAELDRPERAAVPVAGGGPAVDRARVAVREVPDRKPEVGGSLAANRAERGLPVEVADVLRLHGGSPTPGARSAAPPAGGLDASLTRSAAGSPSWCCSCC